MPATIPIYRNVRPYLGPAKVRKGKQLGEFGDYEVATKLPVGSARQPDDCEVAVHDQRRQVRLYPRDESAGAFTTNRWAFIEAKYLPPPTRPAGQPGATLCMGKKPVAADSGGIRSQKRHFWPPVCSIIKYNGREARSDET